MLKERDFFSEDVPISVVTARVDEYPRHFHDDIEVIYVIEGSIVLKSGYYSFMLKKGDIFIVNDREIHSLEKTNEENIVMMLKISMEYFSNYYVNLRESFFFVSGSSNEREYSPVIREIMTKIMIDIIKKGQGYEHKVIESTHNLIACMLKNFQIEETDEEFMEEDLKFRGKRMVIARLRRVMDYIYDNYRGRPTLNDIADMEHLSIFYLSHIIKEATGMSFQDLLSFVRVDESATMLAQTEKKIGAISKEIGFSALRYYTKHFELCFNCSPIEYRNNVREKGEQNLSNARYARCKTQEIVEALTNDENSYIPFSRYIGIKRAKPKIIEVDLEKPFSNNTDFNFVGDMMPSENLRFIERPYNIFRSLNEEKVVQGNNYIVSYSKDEKTGELLTLTILLYSINDDKKRELILAQNKERIYEICSGYHEPMEFLLKFHGINGNFNTIRYKLSSENLSTAYREAINDKGIAEKREGLISSLAAIPNIEFSKIRAADILSIRSEMRGISAELILLDKIK